MRSSENLFFGTRNKILRSRLAKFAAVTLNVFLHPLTLLVNCVLRKQSESDARLRVIKSVVRHRGDILRVIVYSPAEEEGWVYFVRGCHSSSIQEIKRFRQRAITFCAEMTTSLIGVSYRQSIARFVSD